MPRTKGAKDGPSVERTYHKQSDYWDRPTLADLLRASEASYDELRDAALAARMRHTGAIENQKTQVIGGHSKHT